MRERLNLGFGRIKIGVKGKLLVPTIATLIIVIIGLAGVLVTVQRHLNANMRQETEKTLKSANSAVSGDLGKLKNDMAGSLADMAASSSSALSKATSKALNKQKFLIEYDWEEMMRTSGESIALLLARVAPNAILAKNSQALNGYVKAALQNPNVVYAFYYRPDGSLLTRYIDRENKKIKGYLKTGGKNPYRDILEASQKDTSVIIINKSISFQGNILGSVDVCIDKASVAEKIGEMNDRFSDLVSSNKALVSNVIREAAGKVRENVGDIVGRIITKNNSTATAARHGLEQASTAVINQTERITMAGGAICILLVGIVLIFIIQHVLSPLKQTLNVVKDIAEGEGDLTIRLKVASNDEVGELSKWFNTFLDKLQGIIADIAAQAGSLGGSSATLSELSGSLSDGARHMSDLSSNVASAAEQMSANMNTVAASSGEAASNVNMVASAAEEMAATINEIAMNSEKARNISEEAVQQASDVSSRLEILDRAAQSIGNVTQTINDISDQTNLLALNATIEAARAGDVGKGFAVVANEIKELAKQTAEATQEIRNQIDGIQGSTTETIEQIDRILKVIHNVNEIVSTIATAVEEQSVMTKEIAGNVAQASQGIQDVNENVSESSLVSGEIAKEITGVSEVSTQLSGNSTQVNKSAEVLSRLASELNGLVGKFRYSTEGSSTFTSND
jgi:methyl-accepting chemotaxis protein